MVPRERRRSGEVEAVDGGGGDGVPEGVGTGVELGPAKDVEVVAEGDRYEVREAVQVGAAGERGQQGPGSGGRVEEARRGDGGIGGE